MVSLSDKFKDTRVILASKSPRRHELLGKIGLNFQSGDMPSVSEDYPDNIEPSGIPLFLAKKKANAYLPVIDAQTLVITADTIVICDNTVLNKPVDYNDAVRLLQMLSGKEHDVITGVCLKSSNKEDSFVSVTTVQFRELLQEEIDYYISNYKPFDKAGAYGIQEWIGFIGITGIRGCYFNVMGLPLQAVYNRLVLF